MRIFCTPLYTVSYRGEFYEAGEAFEIDPADQEEMARYGKIEEEEEPQEEEAAREEEPQEEAFAELPKRRRRG